MNTIVAESLDYVASRLEQATAGDPGALNAAVQTLLKDILSEHGAVVFNGDGYSQEWQDEAARRGLPNLRTTVDALPELTRPEVVELFERYGVLSQRELESRLDIYLEQYCKSVNTEAALVEKLARTLILPVAFRYQSELATACATLKSIGASYDTRTLDKVSALASGLEDALAKLAEVTSHEGHGLAEEAAHFCNHVIPAMAAVRQHVDDLEGIVPDDQWPLPTYQEMLFIK
jgi:glutamine synthetase